MTEIPSCILSQYAWYNTSIKVDKASVHFLKFYEKNINISRNFLMALVPLKNGMDLRGNTTYTKVIADITNIKENRLRNALRD